MNLPVNFLMSADTPVAVERLPADLARVGPLTGVRPDVDSQDVLGVECLAASLTGEVPLVGVVHEVPLVSEIPFELSSTQLTYFKRSWVVSFYVGL